jgi:O-acetyl-ADP-ribose deacetylase (regulator of RNase III)
MIELIQGDITALDVDAITNAANSALSGGGGVDGAIHRAAGPELLAECRTLGRCPTGDAVRTRGHRLKARFVIHAVGPVWQGGDAHEPELLDRAYESAFARAREEPSIRSIAFPALSAGAYGYPKDQAAQVALRAMLRHEGELDRIIACLFDAQNLATYQRTLERLRG